MIFNLITKAKNIFYKNNKNVAEALDDINSEVSSMSQSLDIVNKDINDIKENVSDLDTKAENNKANFNNYLPKSGGTVNGNLTANRYTSNKDSAVGVDRSAFNLAPFVSNAAANTNETMRAGYGFHNAGVNGTFLYLDTDYRLRTIDNMGVALTLANTADVEAVKGAFTLSGNTLTINMDALS